MNVRKYSLMKGFSFRTLQDDYYDGLITPYTPLWGVEIDTHEFNKQIYYEFVMDTEDDEYLNMKAGRRN